jgi:hypothetical protein
MKRERCAPAKLSVIGHGRDRSDSESQPDMRRECEPISNDETATHKNNEQRIK